MHAGSRARGYGRGEGAREEQNARIFTLLCRSIPFISHAPRLAQSPGHTVWLLSLHCVLAICVGERR